MPHPGPHGEPDPQLGHGPDRRGDDTARLDPVVDGFTSPADAASYQAWPPAGRAPATARARWRLLGLITGGVAASLLLAGVCAGGLTFATRVADGDVFATAPTAPPTFVGQPPLSFSGRYPKPSQLCDSADYTWLRPLFNHVEGKQQTDDKDPVSGALVSTCSGITANRDIPAASGEFLLQVAVFGSALMATDAFDRGHDAYPGGDFTGVGQAAYKFVDPDRGPAITARDYNLVITMYWQPSVPGSLPDGLYTTLANVCRSSLVVLRIG